MLPAKVLGTGQELRAVIDSDKEHLLGKRVIENFDAQLPFLPKVWSSEIRVGIQDLQRWTDHLTDPINSQSAAITDSS